MKKILKNLIKMDLSIRLLNDENNVVNICGKKSFTAFNAAMMKFLFTKYKNENMRKSDRNNPLFNKLRLVEMCELITDERFIEAYNDDDGGEFTEYVDSLFDCLHDCFSKIVLNRNETLAKDLYLELKSRYEFFNSYASDEDLTEKLRSNFSSLAAIIKSKTVASQAVNITGLSSTTRRIFSGIEFINEDIASQENPQPDSTILPFDSSGVDAFLRSCEALGNKIETGVMMGELQDLLDMYKSAVSYFSYVIRKYTAFGGMSDEQKFNFFFTGSTDVEDKKKKPLLDEKGKVIKRFYINIDHKKVSIRFLEYITELYSLQGDQINTKDAFNNRVLKFGAISSIEIIDKMRDSVLSFDGEIIRCDSEPIHDSAKKITKCIFDVLLTTSSAGRSREEDYNYIQESVTSRMKPYWWQQEAIDKAKYGKSFINIGPTSGGKTFGAMLTIAKLIFLPRTQGKLFVFSSPIDQLAIQTFATMYVSFPGIRDKIAIICGCGTYIPSGATFFVGTPKELRDYFRDIPYEVQHEKSNASILLPKSITSSKMRNAYTLVIDECHTISEDYNPTHDGRKISKANEELLEMLYEDVDEGKTNERIFVGLSATLSDESMKELVKCIKKKTNIEMIDTIYYDYPDIGRYDKPTEDISVRVSAHRLPQKKFPIYVRDGIITEATTEQDLNKEIEINPPFIEQLIYKAKEENVLPIAMFFESESQSISTFRSFVDYINKRIDQSQWKALYSNYHSELESCISRVYSKEKMDKMKSDFALKIKNKILEYLGQVRVVGSHKIPQSILDHYLNLFKSYTRERFDNSTMTFTIDLYAFLFEYCEYEKTGNLFQCPIHPYYNFGDNGKTPTIDPQDTDFNSLLQAQDISSSRGGNALLTIITNGLEYGFGVMTSSIPIGFQIKTAEIINSLKKDRNNIKSSATFCDHGMSQGVDYPYNSVAIFRKTLGDISESQYLQENGRGGRNKGDGKFGKSITFTINIKNALRIGSAENLLFSNSQLTANFYSPEDIAEKLSNIVQNTESVISLIQSKQSVNIDSFITEELFPGVLQLRQTSERINYIKRELREMYEICKIICPKTARQYIAPLFRIFQKEGYSLIMASAS